MSKEIPFEKSFASHEKAKYWSDKNVLKPNQVALNSNKKFWFNCDCGHEFNKILSCIAGKKNGWCPYCSNKKLCENEDCKSCFDKSFASNDKAQYWSEKNTLIPRQVFKNSHNKYIFNCDCGHIIEQLLSHITRGNWCPYCSNPPIKLCENKDCKNCFDKSFASHDKSKYWSEKNKLVPRQVFKNSNNKYIFKCSCLHEFEINCANINSNFWCPYCSNPSKKLCENNDCQQCFEKSFTSHEKANYWSEKNALIPRQVFKSSGKKYWFICNCSHNFECNLSSIIKGIWCPYCSNKKLCDKEDCNDCYNKSFASQEKANYWSIKNKLTARQVFKNSNKKFIFVCEKNHEFTSNLANISNNCWCPYCVNKTEQKLYDNLQPIYNNLEQQYKVNWCKSDTTNKCYPFDFVLADQKIIIELDGLQHFEQVSNWDSPDKVHERDKYKMKQANDNGYSVIRILQEDVFYDTYQWLDELKTNIEKLITENKVQNIFMCKDNEYSIFDILE